MLGNKSWSQSLPKRKALVPGVVTMSIISTCERLRQEICKIQDSLDLFQREGEREREREL
jgi:hypothetical protein